MSESVEKPIQGTLSQHELRLTETSIQPRPVESNLSVVIPTLGRSLLEGCLLSIAQGSNWPGRLIVVDQSSNPSISKWLEVLESAGMSIEHLRAPIQGAASARNRGLEHVTTDFIAMTDDDCEVNRVWVQNVTHHLAKDPGRVLTGRVVPGDERGMTSTTTTDKERTYSRPLLRQDVLYSGNMACAAQIFSKVGLFDERAFLRFAEDNDWSYRALRKGVQIKYVPDVEVTHLDWRDEEAQIATYANYARSQGGFYGKHLRAGDAFMLLRILTSLGRASQRTIRGLMRGDPVAIGNGKAFLTRLIPGVVEGFREAR